ncbi:MAG: CinA family nicotinamide mononucleotide deamidase-related protein [Prevotellaceae bacterium]|jgi:nicotinamide-nucleotide amidase|nr:CinA family nicotinamide mononucleotide deamidase-related protein [Prevotellaceae bacterium]
MISCTICTIGDELLIGQVIDTNSSVIAKAINQIGISVALLHSVGDNREDIHAAIDHSLQKSDLLILTGGLGPTKDDITKNTLARYTGSTSFYRSSAQEAHIIAICAKRGNNLLEINRVQADVPDTCSVLENKLGTAPGMWFTYKEKVIISLPGVPFEMEGLLPQVLQRIKTHFGASLSPITHKTLSTIGIPESVLALKIADWENSLPKTLHLAYLPNPRTGVRLRLSDYESKNGEQLIENAFSQLRQILGNAIYSYDNETLEEVIAKLLLEKKYTLSTAESCTGGKIGSIFTSLEGASNYYHGGIIAYHNNIKEKILNVPRQLIDTYGAVSQQCVEAMAMGAQQLFHTDWVIATSGIAGPSGGTKEKPVGTLWIAIASPKTVYSKHFIFSNDRLRNIDRFSVTALNELRIHLLQISNNE